MSSTISNSNYYSVGSSSNNGVAGLISGMDTDKMVKQMLSGTQAKIDAKKQEKQQLEWKQEQYREVISSINGFSSKYFDTKYGSTLSTNLANSDFFSSMTTSVTSGSSLKVVSTAASAATGSHTVNVSRLATAASLQSNVKLSGNQTITGEALDVDGIKSKLAVGEDISLELTLDGVKKNITLSASDFMVDGEFSGDSVTSENIANALGAKTANAFGSYITFGVSDNKISFGIGITDKDGNLENGHELTVTGSDSSYIGISAGSSTLVNGLTKLSSLPGLSADEDGMVKFSINGDNFEFNAAETSVSKMISTVNSGGAGVRMTYSSMTDSFVIEQTSTGKGFDISISDTSGNALSALFGTATVKAGLDAELTIDGVATSRSSNTVSFDGITMTATDIGETAIGTTRDTEKIIDGIKSFVNDYNTLIEDLYGRVTQDADYRNYKPLTSEQEGEMTDKQIDLWEKKAQTGLLRRDTDITSFIDAMRSAVYTSAQGSGLALYSIGIESTTWNGAGKLVIDEDLLRRAVEYNPEGVTNLFTDKTSGVATVLSSACDKAAKVSLSDTGSLVSKSGAKDWLAGEKNNDIFFDLERIKDRLDYLDNIYNSQKTRYWNQFSQMETIMSGFNTQSSMLVNMFS